MIEELFNHYQTKFSQRNHLIINTPGWVKGYGKELLNQITKIINPDKLILLSNNLNQEYPDNANILQDFNLSIIIYNSWCLSIIKIFSPTNQNYK